MNRLYCAAVFILFGSLAVYAQHTVNADEALSKRVSQAPESVFEMFRDAGMNPVNHELTAIEKDKVEAAIAMLPPLHRKVLGSHLHSISFMDNMPNTALTSPVEQKDSLKTFNITFRAGILNETISEWATKKENTLFDRSQNPEFQVSIDAGKLDAFLYVLIHEATHVVDAVLEITPHLEDKGALVEPTEYIRDVWYKMNLPVKNFVDSLVERTIFRGGKPVPVTLAPDIYSHLKKMPFASLYATASWFEDIAEMETIYHLTHKMNQPFSVVVRKNNQEVARFEPMKNKRVKKRLRYLDLFYQTDSPTH